MPSRLNLTRLNPDAYSGRGKITPGFCLWWVAMVYDYALWRGDKPLLNRLIPGVRNIIDQILLDRAENGLVCTPNGWNFHDWVHDVQHHWENGVPPSDADGVCCLFNLELTLVLLSHADLEEYMGEPELAARARRIARELHVLSCKEYWDDNRGLMADDYHHRYFSEHAQCLALLSGLLSPEQTHKAVCGLLEANDLARTSIYYSYYLFETLRVTGRADLLTEKLVP